MSEVAKKEVVIYPTNNGDIAKLPLVADIQFLEPFSSEALNRKFLGVVPAGIYRGFDVQVTGDNTVRVGDDSGKNTAFVERDGVTITVQGQHPVDLTIPYDTPVAVVIEAIYKHGLVTKQVDSSSVVDAASIKVIPQADRQEYHLTVCEITLPSGSALTDEMIDTSARTNAGVLDTFTREEITKSFVAKANAATITDIEKELKSEKHITLATLWAAISQKISGIPIYTISTLGALKGGGKLDGNLEISINDASESEKGAVQLSSSLIGVSKAKAATEYVISQLKKLIDGKADSEHSHNASHINAGTLNSERLPTATLLAKGASQLTNSYTSSSQLLTPTAKALSDGLSKRAEKVDYRASNGQLQVARRSWRTVINRDDSGNGLISIDASSFEENDEIIIHNAHPKSGVVTITNLDGTIYLPDGESGNSHTLTGQGSVLLMKLEDSDLKVIKVY